MESDETFVGGQRKNKSRSKRRETKSRGPIDMTPVVGVKDRANNEVRARAIPRIDVPHVTEHATLGAKVYTDHAAVYRVLDAWYDREAANHSTDEYVNPEIGASTQGIESFYMMFKRGYHGTYHYMSPKHLDRYVAEFSGRHNVREADTINQMGSLVAASVGKRPMCRDLIAE